MSKVLTVANLTKSFGGRKAVDALSFELNKGEVTAILGPNGSGKTTSIKCLAGLLKPDFGSVSVMGINARQNPRSSMRQISYLPQNAEFPQNITALETIRFHAQLRGIDDNAARHSLTQCGFTEADIEKHAGQLSGGMRHRLSLAIAGLSNTPLMLLDEPTANLDPAAAQRFRTIAKSWRNEGRAILMATHVLSDVTEVADRVIVMVDGKVVAMETISQLRTRLNRFSRLRVDVGAVTESHRDAAMCAGALDIRMNGKAIIVSAPEEKRLAILNRLEEVGVVAGFETEKPSIEHLYLEYVNHAEKSS
jgi:ABC-type multidrug transport system ATPase subunit